MAKLSIQLLGAPQIKISGEHIGIKRQKSLALLAYLAVTGQPHRRDILANLLWPNATQEKARTSLRIALSELKKQLGNNWIQANRHTIGLLDTKDIWVDYRQFTGVIDSDQGVINKENAVLLPEQLQDTAVSLKLYQGEFMAGFSLPDSHEFDLWQQQIREEAQQKFSTNINKLIQAHIILQSLDAALSLAQHWVSHIPWEESAHLSLIEICIKQQDMSLAANSYQKYAAMMEHEFGMLPEKEFSEIVERNALPTPSNGITEIDPSQITASKTAKPNTQAQTHLPKHFLPTYSSPFVGRDNELTEVITNIQLPTCRILSLVGPGGIGKSRLAVEAGQHLLNHPNQPNVEQLFSDGIYFIALVSIKSELQMISAIAHTLGFQFLGKESHDTQLKNFLRNKSLLLVLDNFEQLTEFADFLDALVHTAPNVKIISTSRQRLGIPSEWPINVDGLTYPTESTEDLTALSDFDSIRLFKQRAQRQFAGFQIDPENAEAIVNICELIEGHPLAIELAATWVRLFTCSEILSQLEKGVDLLKSTDNYSRHQSIEVVFNQTWSTLNQHERSTLCKLSLFPAGFTLDAASALDTTRTNVANLMDKNLLYRRGNGWYFLHELLRQFLLEKLRLDQPMYVIEHTKYAAYYADLLNESEEKIKGSGVTQALDTIGANLANILVAWNWMIGKRDLEGIDRCIRSIAYYCGTSKQTSIGLECFEHLQKQIIFDQDVARETAIWAKLQIRKNALLYAQGNINPQMQEQVEESLQHLERVHDTGEHLYGLSFLSELLLVQGKMAKAKRTIIECMEKAKQFGSPGAQGSILLKYGTILFQSEGLTQEVEQAFVDALDIYKSINHKINICATLYNLANINAFKNNIEPAVAYADEAVQISRELNDNIAIIKTLSTAANMALRNSEIQKAKLYLAECIELCIENGYFLDLAGALVFMGQLSLDQEDAPAAHQSATKAIEIYQEQTHAVGLMNTYNLLGQAANLQRDYNEALSYYEKGLDIAIESAVDWQAAKYYSLIARNDLDQNLFDQSITGFIKALKFDSIAPKNTLEALLASCTIIFHYHEKQDIDPILAIKIIGFVQASKQSSPNDRNVAKKLDNHHRNNFTERVYNKAIKEGEIKKLEEIKEETLVYLENLSQQA